MADVFVIAIAKSIAGLLTRQTHGFRFYSGDTRFDAMHGTYFASPRDAAESALILERRSSGRISRRFEWSDQAGKRNQPITLSEIVAAGAVLDFGGLPLERSSPVLDVRE